MKRKRSAGILLPITSLPSSYGIGTLGREAYAFVDFLKKGPADEIFAYADLHPEIVKPYYDGYPVLLFEKKSLL